MLSLSIEKGPLSELQIVHITGALFCRNILIKAGGASACGGDQAEKETNGGGLSCSIGADKAEYVPLLDREVDIVMLRARP